MRKLILALAVLMGVIVFGDNVWAENQFLGSFSSNVSSEYILTNGATVYRKPVLSNSLFILHKQSGISAFVWEQKGLDSNETGGDEIDFVLTWSKSIGSYNFSTGVAYLDLIGLTNLPDGDIIQPFVSMEKKVNLVSFYVKMETPFPAKGGSPENGYHVFGGIERSWEITSHFSFNQHLQILYDGAACGFDYGLIGRGKTSIIYAMNDFSIDVGAIVSTPLSNVDDGREFEVIPSVGVTYKF